MKKTVIIVVLTGMFVWAVYDLAVDSQDKQQAGESDFTVEEDDAEQNSADGSDSSQNDSEADGDSSSGGSDNSDSSDSDSSAGGADNSEDSGDSENSDDNEQSDTVGLQTGNIAPDFKLKTLAGDSMQLSDFRGERVMVNFWATWCPPCRAEVPDMQKFYENKDINILAVNLTSTESSRDDVKEFAEEFGMTFPVLMDKNTKVARDLYQIKPIPSSFMIDSEGRIQYRALGAMNYELMVREFEKME